jgi:hypothetical protein
MSKPLIIDVRCSGTTYHARVRGTPYTRSCTAGEQQAALACAQKCYGIKASVERAKEHDTHSRGNAHGSENSIYRSAYLLIK